MGKDNQEPFKALGSKLKFLREQWQQSITEVSGTLEIDETALAAIEAGNALPADEVLDLLINHFLLTEEQAQDLRELATSQKQQGIDSLSGSIEDMLMKQIVMYMPVDNKIVYTDGMQATVTDHGVVLQFMQRPAPDGQQTAVSRVGMSRDHAEKVIEVLKNTLAEHDRNQRPKLLPEKSS